MTSGTARSWRCSAKDGSKMWRRWPASSAAKRTPTWASRPSGGWPRWPARTTNTTARCGITSRCGAPATRSVELTPNPNKELDFEKEFDEGPVADDGRRRARASRSHNVSEVGPDVGRASEMSSQEEWPEDRTPIMATGAAPPVGAYPHARRVGDLLFLSGIGPRRPVTNEIPAGIEAQTLATIDNVRAILEASGSSLEKILDVTVYLTDMKSDFERFNRVYAECWERFSRRGPRSASTRCRRRSRSR